MGRSHDGLALTLGSREVLGQLRWLVLVRCSWAPHCALGFKGGWS